MILVDAAVGSHELQSWIRRLGPVCDSTHLVYGDAAFEGHGPEGLCGIGVERKRLRDMLNCIDDARYTGHQRIGMSKQYQFSFLIIEGVWRPDIVSGLLYRQVTQKSLDSTSNVWTPQWGQGMREQMYYKLRRYLFSVSLSGVHVLYTRDISHTAFDIVELYHYFQKPWREHKSMLQMHQRSLTLPTLNARPNLVRRWAFELDGVGNQYAHEAGRIFRTPRQLALSDEDDWLKIPGIGPKTAIDIVRQIGGVK
jgi:ERCC4-type nuclease